MKKLVKYLLFSFILLVGFTVKAHASVSFYEGDYVDSIYINKIKNGVTHYMRARFLQKRDDNTIAYCLDPFNLFNENDTYTKGNAYSKITASNLNKIKLAAYYGYGFSNHTAKKWYAITQMIIWKYADPNGNYYFTDSLNGNKITTYDKDMKELETLIKEHEIKPSFANKSYTINLGESITLTDTNKVIAKYSISSQNLKVIRADNNFTIEGSKVGTYKINLTKSGRRFNKNPIFYLTNGSQNLMTAGDIENVTVPLEVKVIGGSLKIIKHDEDTKTCKPSGEASLKGATYNLYKEDKLIDTLVINDLCEATIDNLEIGNYVLKEISPGEGYLLDKKEYSFTIDKEHVNITLNVTNKVMKRKIKITKLYGNKELENYKVEPNITFGIYDKNQSLVSTITTNKSGQTSFQLPYGTYTIKQLTTTKNYELCEDQVITICENRDEEINLVLKNNIMTSKLKVYKVDKEKKQIIVKNSALFKIKDLNDNKFIYHQVDGKNTNIFKTNEEGFFITDISLPAGKYELIEIQAPTGYIINKRFTFEISEDCNFLLEEDGTKFIELYVQNEKAKIKRIQVPDTLVSITNSCWYPILFNMYLYDEKRYS